MSRGIAALDTRLARDRDAEKTLDDALDPYNRSINQFDTEVKTAGFSEMAVFDAKLGAINHAVQRIDRIMGHLQHLKPENTTQRSSISLFETYWRGSDQFHDRITAARGMAKAVELNPLSALAIGDEGSRFRQAQYRYVHGLQGIVNALADGIDDIAAERNRRKRRLDGIRAKSMIAWLQAP